MTTINNIDWTVLQLDGVADVTTKAAAKVAVKFHGVTTYDDLHQEAVIMLASHPETVRDYIDRHEARAAPPLALVPPHRPRPP